MVESGQISEVLADGFADDLNSSPKLNSIQVAETEESLK